LEEYDLPQLIGVHVRARHNARLPVGAPREKWSATRIGGVIIVASTRDAYRARARNGSYVLNCP
jgi:hypothetical protein